MEENKVVEIKNISMTYHTLEGETEAIENIVLDVYKGEIVSLVGPSGCGKSTLLSIIAGLIEPTKGEVFINGELLDPYLVVLNSLPKTALAPIIILWVGAGYSGIIVTAITVSIIITIMNVYNGFISVDADKIKLLQTFGATKSQILKKVVLPSSIPTIISTLKVNIGLSWVGVIVGEFLVSKAGIGYLIVYGGQVFKLDLVMMSVFILAIISALMYQLIAFFENKFTKWQQ